MFKLNMICNKLPNINHPDAATWSRVRVVPFQSTFLPEAECPASVPEQFRLKKFPMDRRIADNLGEMRQALVYYMISRYNRIGDIDQTEPRDVLVATEKYQRESDIYSQFVAECMVSTVPEDRETAGIGDVSAVFKQWMNAEYPHMPSVTRTHMKEQLNAKLGACTNRGWPNRRVGLYCVEEEEEEMDVD